MLYCLNYLPHTSINYFDVKVLIDTSEYRLLNNESSLHTLPNEVLFSGLSDPQIAIKLYHIETVLASENELIGIGQLHVVDLSATRTEH